MIYVVLLVLLARSQAPIPGPRLMGWNITRRKAAPHREEPPLCRLTERAGEGIGAGSAVTKGFS